MTKWIDFSRDEKIAMIQGVATSLNIDEVAVEKDWWVILCCMHCTKHVLQGICCLRAYVQLYIIP